MMKPVVLLLAAAAAAIPVGAGAAQQPIAPVNSMDPAAAEAGNYILDERHTSVIARVRHLGFGYTAIRFDKVTGNLDWDPADPTRSRVSIVIDPKQISTPVTNAPGGGTFADLLKGPQWLDGYTHNAIRFESTRVTRRDATHGTVEGNLTLKGVTRPTVLNVEFLGAGTDNQREPTVAFTATAQINRRDFDITTFPPNFVGDEVLFLIDVEFNKHGPNHRD